MQCPDEKRAICISLPNFRHAGVFTTAASQAVYDLLVSVYCRQWSTPRD